MIEMTDEAGIIDIRTITNGLPLTEEKIEAIIESPLRIFSISVDAGTAKSYEKLKGEDGFDKIVRLVKHAWNHKKKLGKDFPLLRVSYYPSPETAGEEDIFIDTFIDYVDFIDMQEFKDLRQVAEHELRTDCLMPFRRLAVFANGEVAPCCAFYSKKLIVGDVGKQTLKEIWNGDVVSKIREELIQNDFNSVCEECLNSVGAA